MRKFKIGDKVQFVGRSTFVGEYGRVVGLVPALLTYGADYVGYYDVEVDGHPGVLRHDGKHMELATEPERKSIPNITLVFPSKPKFKIGDKVKIINKEASESTIGVGWNEAMDKTLGTTGTIEGSTGVTSWIVLFNDLDRSWVYVEDSLELVTNDVDSITGQIQGSLELTAEHPLQTVFNDVIAQITTGKGNERHGNGKDFMEQPWVALAETHGRGFLTGQSSKKLAESQGMTDPDRWEREMFGVIAYAAMAIIHDRNKRLEK